MAENKVEKKNKKRGAGYLFAPLLELEAFTSLAGAVKVKGVYAALLNNVYQAERAQLSNNANVITLGAQVTGIELGKCLVREYLANTYDSASRSGPKVQAIVEYEAAN